MKPQEGQPKKRLMPPMSAISGSRLPHDQTLVLAYKECLRDDAGTREEALNAHADMLVVPHDALDEFDEREFERRHQDQGLVGRRAPKNPLASPLLGKYRMMHGQEKAKDPALEKNPLRGRLIVMLTTSAALMCVFVQSIVLEQTTSGRWMVGHDENPMYGPSGSVLLDLGGLNANQIREGQGFRILWAMWMHSGWLHILLNVSSQMQFFFMTEPDWGFTRSILLFWISGITGNLVSCVCNPCSTTVGSSGGLFGLMGGMIPYCIEYWSTIPRPCFLVVFSAVILLISILSGFTESTDNWAHLGGMLGGILFGLGTVTTLSFCEPGADGKTPIGKLYERVAKRGQTDNQPPAEPSLPATGPVATRRRKKVVRHGKVLLQLQRMIAPRCRCGFREWTVRLVSLSLLVTVWVLCFVHIYDKYEYVPFGHITYQGPIPCSCCYVSSSVPPTSPEYRSVKNWKCFTSNYIIPSGERWGGYCERTLLASRRLDALESQMGQLPAESFFQLTNAMPSEVAESHQQKSAELVEQWLNETRNLQAVIFGDVQAIQKAISFSSVIT